MEVDFSLYNFETAETICDSHIDDDFIKSQIKSNGVRGKCSYCNKFKNIVELSFALELIVVGIDYLFEDPNDSRYYDKDSEYGFDGNIMNFHSLWYDDLLNLNINNSQLAEDIYRYLNNDSLYCYKNEFYSESDDLLDLWSTFKDTVKYKARFVFHYEDVFKKSYHFFNPVDVLDNVQHYIQRLNLFTFLPANSKLFRTRQHQKKTEIKSAEDITSVPKEYSKTNGRMNPAGISMFYCSQDKELTVKEVVDFKSMKNKFYTTAIFRNVNDLKLVDLSNLPHLPSIFDAERSDDIQVLYFLRNFVRDISMPVEEDTLIVEYIPTQIVTEYIRFNPVLKVDGIIYPSAKDNTKNNIVLFFDHEESLKRLKYSSTSKKTFTIP
ncbi:MAG: HEPN-associated N-terminal domain-containing protein [Flavobacterium sp.]